MHRVVKIPVLFFIILVFTIFTSVVNTAELYVSKNLKVHTKASLDSPVNHLLLGGEKVEVISIDGDLTEIQDAGDHIGWVASEFLSDIKPVNMENQNLKKSAKQQVGLKKEKNKEKQQKGTVNGSGATLNSAQELKSIERSKKLLAQMQQENQQLQKQLEQIRNILNMTSSNTNNYNAGSKNNLEMTLWIIAGGILLGFILGFLWSDFRNRKRHGGFSI